MIKSERNKEGKIMFELLQLDKEKVDRLLKEIKENRNTSFTDFGNCIGLKESTISFYVQGYNWTPMKVIEKIAKFIDKSMGWFYFDGIEEYIADYLQLKWQDQSLYDYRDTAYEIQQIIFTGESKNSDWENEVGYPAEEFIDDCFVDIQERIM